MRHLCRFDKVTDKDILDFLCPMSGLAKCIGLLVHPHTGLRLKQSN